MTPEVQTATRSRRVALLGPQHREPSLKSVLESLGPDVLAGPIALVSAGWQEREAETGNLEEHLGAEVRKLDLWPRCEDAFRDDPELQRLMFERYDRMRALGRLYRERLAAELGVLRHFAADLGKPGGEDLIGPALDVAFDAVQDLDAHHAARVRQLSDRTFEEARSRDAVRSRADEVAGLLAGAKTLLVAGGHVGILYNRMRMFGVLDALPTDAHVVGWSAGAMVLTERIVLFHDAPPQGAGNPEVHGPGFGLARGVVTLPHAASRLHLDDAARVMLLARRFTPALPVALDDGQYVVSEGSDWRFDGGARVLGQDGDVQTPAMGDLR